MAYGLVKNSAAKFYHLAAEGQDEQTTMKTITMA